MQLNEVFRKGINNVYTAIDNYTISHVQQTKETIQILSNKRS